jgi:hypothetical protein
MKRSSRRRSRKRRKQRPRSNSSAPYVAEVRALVDKAIAGRLEEDEAQRLLTALQSVSVAKEMLLKGTTVAELRQMMWERVALPAIAARNKQPSGSAPAAADDTQDGEAGP